MKVRSPLAMEGAVMLPAVLRGPEALEAFLQDLRVLAVIVGVHLNVGRADVHLITVGL